mgnify:CR=1 FL=1
MNGYIAHDFGLVRIVHDGSPFTNAYDVRVMWKPDEEWLLFQGFNSLSDDYAHTNAREAAGRAIKKIAKKKAEMIVGTGEEV